MMSQGGEIGTGDGLGVGCALLTVSQSMQEAIRPPPFSGTCEREHELGSVNKTNPRTRKVSFIRK